MLSEIKKRAAGYSTTLTLISGLITTIGGLSNYLYGIHIWQLSLVLVCMGIYLIARSILMKIVTSNVTRLGQVHWDFPEPKRKRSEKLLVLNNIAFSAIVLTSCSFYFYEAFLHKDINQKKFAIVISNFTEKGIDRFSLDLGNCLNDSLYKYDTQDTIAADNLSSYLPYYNKNKMHHLRDTFLKSGYNHGILVFGHRIDKDNEFSKNFQCRIFLCKASNRVMDAFTHDRPVIKVPEIFDFRISDEVNKVYYFIIGLLFNQLGNMIEADTKILSALNLDKVSNNGSSEDKKFTAYCYLLLAQNKFIKKDYKEAIDLYNKGITCDSTNALLHYNLGVTLWNLNNNKDAYKKFFRANELDKDLIIPIEYRTEAPSAPDPPSSNVTNTSKKTLTIIPVANTSSSGIAGAGASTGTNNPPGSTNPTPGNLTSNTPTNSAISTKTNAIVTNQKDYDGEWIDESEIDYHVVIFSSKNNLGYITTDGRYIKFKSGNDEAFYIIGKYKREGYNSFAIYDLYNNPVYSVIDKTIYFYKTSNAVGELRAMKK